MTDKILFFTCAYNAEKTLRRAMDSILNQTYKNWIYYVLDNGSMDGTLAIIREYEKRDSRIHCLSVAENNVANTIDTPLGVNGLLPEIEYDWLAILDSDDVYDNFFAERMVEFARSNNLDVACCATQIFSEKDGELKDSSYWHIPEDMILEGNMFADMFPKYFTLTGNFWAKIISAKVLNVCDFLLMSEVYLYSFDSCVVRGIFLHSARVGFSKQFLHKYYIDSSSGIKQYRDTDIDGNCRAHDNILDYLTAINGANDINISVVYSNYAMSIVFLVNAILNTNKLNHIEKLSELRRLLSVSYSRVMLNNESVSITLYKSSFERIAKWVLKLENVGDCIGTFIWLLLVTNRVVKSDASELLIKEVLAHEFLTSDLDLVTACYLRSPVAAILDKDLQTAFDELLKIADDDIPNEHVESYLKMTINICAAIENADAYILFTKHWITYLIEKSRYEEAVSELSDLQNILPDDDDLKDFHCEVTELTDRNTSVVSLITNEELKAINYDVPESSEIKTKSLFGLLRRMEFGYDAEKIKRVISAALSEGFIRKKDIELYIEKALINKSLAADILGDFYE